MIFHSYVKLPEGSWIMLYPSSYPRDFPIAPPASLGDFPASHVWKKRRRRDLKPRLRAVILEALSGRALDPQNWAGKSWKERKLSFSDWWFGTFFIFHNIWDNPSHWLIFFRGVETTNQFLLTHILLIFWFLSSLVNWKGSWFILLVTPS